MAGRRQHHIPQFVLRAWASPESTDRTTRVWVFLKNKVIHASTKDVAVEKDFYSDPSKDGTETLDDQITGYEPALAAKLNTLRETPVGGAAEPRLVGEVIAHLTIRNAHLRYSFREGFGALMQEAAGVFGDPGTMRSFFGIDKGGLTGPLKARLDEIIDSDPNFTQLPIPRDKLYQIAFALMRENFVSFLANDLPAMMEGIERVAAEVSGSTRKSHGKALAIGFAPDIRIKNWLCCIGRSSNRPRKLCCPIAWP